MLRKVVAVWITLIMIVSSIVILVEIAPIVHAPTTLYVGGAGGGNYSRIQDAINASINGDTVFVFNGTYYENIIINRSIILIGENNEDTIINGSGTGDVVFVSENNVIITNLTLTYSGAETYDAGIDLWETDNCSIINNICLNNNLGIYSNMNSENNTLIRNNITLNRFHGTYNNGANHTISNNTYSFNNDDGLRISGSNHIVENNTIFYNCIAHVYDAGIRISGHGNYISGNKVLNNKGHNIYASGSNIGGNIIIANNISNIGAGYGIYLHLTRNNSVIANEINSGNNAIRIDSSMQMNITNNKITKGTILSLYSDYNNITNNNLSNSRITLSGSIGNNLSGNIILRLAIQGVMREEWNTHSIDMTNTVFGRPVYYLKNEDGANIPHDMGQIIIANCTNITIANLEMTYPNSGIHLGFSERCNLFNNTLSDTSEGGNGISLYRSPRNHIFDNMISLSDWWYGSIELDRSDYNLIENNNISDNRAGIYLDSCDYNNITRNLIFSNFNTGISLIDSTFNYVYHNNIIDNGDSVDDSWNENYWDIGYPSGGNYWSDYNGNDNYYGPSQDIPGGDGIGDSRYYIDITSPDYYPLMEPIENYIALNKGWNFISIPFIQTDQDLLKVLEMINGRYDAIQMYNSTETGKPWKHHRVGKAFGNDLFKLNETMGFWVHINQSGQTLFLCNGLKPVQNQTIPLHPGWNMVGYPSLTNHNRIAGLNNLEFGVDVDCIQWYDAATKTWHFMGPDDHFSPGRGYWVHSKVEAGWEVPL